MTSIYLKTIIVNSLQKPEQSLGPWLSNKLKILPDQKARSWTGRVIIKLKERWMLAWGYSLVIFYSGSGKRGIIVTILPWYLSYHIEPTANTDTRNP